MARIKKTSVKTGANARRTTTTSSRGTYTNSSSQKNGNQRTTYTQKSNGQSYTTVTTRFGDGSYERRRISSYSPKTPRKSKNANDGIPGGPLILVALVVLAIIGSFFQ